MGLSPKGAKSRRKSVDHALNKKEKVNVKKGVVDGRQVSHQFVVVDDLYVKGEEVKPFHMSKALETILV